MCVPPRALARGGQRAYGTQRVKSIPPSDVPSDRRAAALAGRAGPTRGRRLRRPRRGVHAHRGRRDRRRVRGPGRRARARPAGPPAAGRAATCSTPTSRAPSSSSGRATATSCTASNRARTSARHSHAWATDRRFLTPMQDFVGDAAPELFTEKLNLKRPERGGVNPLHQDYPYWVDVADDPATVATAMLFLDDSTLDNGCLRVVPGKSHERRVGPAHRRQSVPRQRDRRDRVPRCRVRTDRVCGGNRRDVRLVPGAPLRAEPI